MWLTCSVVMADPGSLSIAQPRGNRGRHLPTHESAYYAARLAEEGQQHPRVAKPRYVERMVRWAAASPLAIQLRKERHGSAAAHTVRPVHNIPHRSANPVTRQACRGRGIEGHGVKQHWPFGQHHHARGLGRPPITRDGVDPGDPRLFRQAEVHRAACIVCRTSFAIQHKEPCQIQGGGVTTLCREGRFAGTSELSPRSSNTWASRPT
jgi:hypothetical protein